MLALVCTSGTGGDFPSHLRRVGDGSFVLLSPWASQTLAVQLASTESPPGLLVQTATVSWGRSVPGSGVGSHVSGMEPPSHLHLGCWLLEVGVCGVTLLSPSRGKVPLSSVVQVLWCVFWTPCPRQLFINLRKPNH